MMNGRLNYCPDQNPRKTEMRHVTKGNQDEFSHPGILFRKNVSLGHRKAGGEPHAWFSGSSIAFSASIMTSILDGHSGLGNSGLSSEFESVDEFLDLVILFRKNVSRGHRKAGGEPHAWFSGLSIAFSASIMTSILDGHSGLGNSRLSSEMVSVRSEKSFESLDERELMLNAPDSRRDVNESITAAVLRREM